MIMSTCAHAYLLKAETGLAAHPQAVAAVQKFAKPLPTGLEPHARIEQTTSEHLNGCLETEALDREHMGL